MSKNLTGSVKVAPPKGLRIEDDGVFQIVPTLSSKVWMAVFSSVVVGMVAWSYQQTGVWDTTFKNAGLGVFLLAMEWFRFLWEIWRPGDKRGRPIVRLAGQHQLDFFSAARWPGKQSISLTKTPCLTIRGEQGNREYEFRTRDPSKQLFPQGLRPNWGKSLENTVEGWLRGLEQRDLLTIEEKCPPENFFEVVRGDY